MSTESSPVESGGLIRPEVSAEAAITIARTCYGIEASASELGSNQDRNYLLTEPDGTKSVLRIDNAAFSDDAREAQHAALAAYCEAGVEALRMLPGLDGSLTQRYGGYAVRRSAFIDGVPMVDLGYFAPVVREDFGQIAARSVLALAPLTHPGLDAPHLWDMRVAYEQTGRLAPAIADDALRDRLLSLAAAANTALAGVAEALPVQAIHGDLTDDNVVGRLGNDARVHPHAVLDLGDLAYGWRVAELAVTVSSMLHHDPHRPLSALDTIGAFHELAPLTRAEAVALWPLVVLRGALLVASGHRQLEIDGDNEYARERIAGEQAIFDAATVLPLEEMREHVLARLGFDSALPPAPTGSGEAPLRSLMPGFSGPVVLVDLGVESEWLDEGRWQEPDAETSLIQQTFAAGAAAAVLSYGQFRLTRASTDAAEPAATWPIDTELWFPAGRALEVTAPVAGNVLVAEPDSLTLELAGSWRLQLHGVQPDVQPGTALHAGAGLGQLAASDALRSIRVTVFRPEVAALIPDLNTPCAPEASRATALAARLLPPHRVPAWSRLTHDPAGMLGLATRVEHDEAAVELERRGRLFASAQERYYERPMQIERGWRHHLIDTTGRSYVDMVNNVTGLGHGHPAIAEAARRQLRLLGTNSRFLYRELADYSERLLALLPHNSGLDTVLLVNSGSEAVDLAIRLAQAATGRKSVIALREAYHGWTMASDAVTTSAYDNPFALENRPDWVHIADVPNRTRGTYRGDDAGEYYVSDLGNDVQQLVRSGRPPAAFICESVLGNAGGVLLPDGYLSGVYEHVRAAGGLCIADEVQVGFGRMGSSFWGFERSGVLPDIITIAKPMGNGFPIGGVITSKRVADALSTQGQFFSSAGGNPVSCAVGIAVLDTMQREGLQENARIVGARLRAGFSALAERHAIIGPVHGEGLYLGVELVRDRETMEPATAEAAAICERLKELGVIVLTTSERSNVLKIKPPLCLTAASADFVVEQLGRVLNEGW